MIFPGGLEGILTRCSPERNRHTYQIALDDEDGMSQDQLLVMAQQRGYFQNCRNNGDICMLGWICTRMLSASKSIFRC